MQETIKGKLTKTKDGNADIEVEIPQSIHAMSHPWDNNPTPEPRVNFSRASEIDSKVMHIISYLEEMKITDAMTILHIANTIIQSQLQQRMGYGSIGV
jgi:hypothetical protein